MRVLMLTWEFPPYIAGGLGMACYGLVKALLSMGVEIDLFLPTAEEVYFPMRRPEDADVMPVEYIDPSRRLGFSVQNIANLRERLERIGLSAYPESYVTPGFKFESFLEGLFNQKISLITNNVDVFRISLRGDDPLFKKVQELVTRVVKYSSFFCFDIIHAHDWLTYPAGLALSKIKGKKLVSHIHATEFDRAGGPGDGRIHDIEYLGLAGSDLVVAVSKYTSQMIIDRYLIAPDKIRVVYNAYSISEHASLERKKVFKDPVVLFMGRITIQKGPDYFLEIADKVLRRFPDVRFIMAGTGDMFGRILKSSASKRLKDRFLFAGFLNRSQVEEMLASSDIFVLPSVSEPFGIVPLEAMAFGVVSIVSKQSGVSEVVENVFKVDFWDIDKTADVIVDLLKHPKKRARIALEGQKEALAIGWREAAGKLADVYRELL